MQRYLPMINFTRFAHKSIAIREALSHGKNRDQLINQSVSVQGWIRSLRQHKQVLFLDVNDGSCQRHLQIVVPASLLPQNATFGSSVKVSGDLVRCSNSSMAEAAAGSTAEVPASKAGNSTAAAAIANEAIAISDKPLKQEVELHASDIQVVGPCDNKGYPIKVRKPHTLDYIRQFVHLRPRTSTFGALLRIRNAATFSIHQHLQSEGFIQIQTPVITSNDCEGAGEVFTILGPPDDKEVVKVKSDNVKTYFGQSAYLTVSAQLHLEAAACALGRVYTMGPTFRAENSRTRHHLSEFTMLEAELAFTQSLDDITGCVEKVLKKTAQHVVNNCPEEFEFYMDRIAPSEHLKTVEKILSKPFVCLTYSQAVDILQQHNQTFENKISWGLDLQKEHERHLVTHCDNVPVFVTHYPTTIKPFYAKLDKDPTTVSAVDLLMPGVGEVCGGSLREDDASNLQARLADLQTNDKLGWYIDLRRYGTVPHGGFGVGFDRFLQCLLGVSNIKDIVPFPRSPNSCPL